MTPRQTIRQMLESFSHPMLEDIVSLIDRDGEQAVYGGFPALEDDTCMVRGMIIQAAAMLAAYDWKNDDPRYQDHLRQVNNFSRLLINQPLKTWGKLKLLIGLCALDDANLFSHISEEALTIYRQASDFEDFFDKEAVTLKLGLPTNYYHVAMACAAYREKLGWEKKGMADAIRDRMLGMMQSNSSEGWSDEQPPYGRFDTYSLNVPMELAAPLLATGHEIPAQIMDALMVSARAALALRNARGDGFPYGRSLCIHGDLTPIEILGLALELNLFEGKERQDAIAYLGRCIRKIKDFWYDPELGFINIWLKGRATNQYRNISRILSVNVETHLKLFDALQTAEKLGFADTVLPESDFGKTDTWACQEILFDQKENRHLSLFLLRRQDRLFALPLISAGRHFLKAAYLPFPAMPRLLEAPPDSPIPFLVPHYILPDGRRVVPAGFYETIQVENGTDRVVITARGNMSLSDPPRLGGNPEAHAPYTAIYTFDGDTLSAQFDTEAEIAAVQMVYAGNARVEVLGFDQTEALDVANEQYHTPHGAPEKGMQWTGKNARVGYRIQL